jgi:excisionase family DNA binding protein
MRLITIADACARLSISRSTFYRLVQQDKMPLVRLSARRVAVPESAIVALIGGA